MTPKQQRFVAEYLIDLNATQAAIRAGYSTKRADAIGYENLRKPEIAKAIEEAQQKRAERTEITQDRVLKELAKIGFSDIRKVIKWGNTEVRMQDEESSAMVEHHGIAIIDSSEIDDDTAAAISEVSQGKEGIKVKLHDKKGALVDIGRHLGMFTDRLDITSKNQKLQSGVLIAPPLLTEGEWESQQ